MENIKRYNLDEKTGISIDGDIVRIDIDKEQPELKVKVESVYIAEDGVSSINIEIQYVYLASLDLIFEEEDIVNEYQEVAIEIITKIAKLGLLDHLDTVERKGEKEMIEFITTQSDLTKYNGLRATIIGELHEDEYDLEEDSQEIYWIKLENGEKIQAFADELRTLNVCHNCETEIDWNSGSDNGNIYECEDNCGNHICVDCILNSPLYEEDILNSTDGLMGLEKISCLECKEKEKAEDDFTDDEKAILGEILNKFYEIEVLFNKFNYDTEKEMLNFHNEGHSLNHCLRWGLQATEDLIEG